MGLTIAWALFACGQATGGDTPATQPPPVLRTEAGPIRGATVEADGRTIQVYKGIPYAAPPIGPLRWKPPQPATPWAEVRDCLTFGPACPQPFAPIFIGGDTGPKSEACLFLNVWTPAGAGPKRPVMVWLHGGAATIGSAALPYYDGARLAARGVVVVSVNYRLGPFGFFAHPALAGEPGQRGVGNYGLLDQIAALQWIRRNIATFGGDPDNVTLFGESAGGQCATLLMLSPLAKGLFHRAIAQSGTALGQLATLREREAAGRRVAEELGRGDDMAALRAKSADDLLRAGPVLLGPLGDGIWYSPVVGGDVVPDDPVALCEKGAVQSMPLLIGSNADDAKMFLGLLPLGDVGIFEQVVRRLAGDLAPDFLRVFPPPKDLGQLEPALNRLATVWAFTAPAREFARAASRSHPQTFLYQFTRVSPAARLLKLGAVHAAEIFYVFGTQASLTGLGLGYDATDRGLSDQMMRYWVNFATKGDPNGPGLPPWPVYTPERDEHLEFGDVVRVDAGLERAACDVVARALRARLHPKG